MDANLKDFETELEAIDFKLREKVQKKVKKPKKPRKPLLLSGADNFLVMLNPELFQGGQFK